MCHSDTMVAMDKDIATYLDALKRDECYRVDLTFKEGDEGTTQKVFFVGANGAEHGPYVRKYLPTDKGNGLEYRRIQDAQDAGVRFLHIPRIIDCYAISDATNVVVTEFIEGQTLDELVTRSGGSIQIASQVFPALCEAVSELHTKFSPPMIHRDLKPSNVIVQNGNISIIDFGIARTFKEGSSSDTNHFGTREYAPPEQYGFGQTDVRSDVYALGMILYFMVTGCTPTSQARGEGFAHPFLTEDMRSVISKATSIDPSERFSSVDELYEGFCSAMFKPALLSTPESGNSYQQDATFQIAYQPTGLDEARSDSWSFMSKKLAFMPLWIGRVWEIFLIVFCLVMMVGGIGATFAPTGNTDLSRADLWVRVLSFGAVSFLMLPSIAYLVSDHRVLCKWIPALKKLHRKRKDLWIAMIGIVLSVVLIAIAGNNY